ncbi:MAG TPA: DUF3866 family protein, partial [Firmicutes bacterium]|nr:DUF3866 family protein [Bacillota bacterium]
RVAVEGEERKAVAYPDLTGPVAAGDRVTLNTTATALGLGSGGFDFVVAADGERSQDPPAPGHLMKLRYTPLQVKVLSVEEEASPYRAEFEACASLAGTPVVVGTLHSQLAPVCLAIRHFAGEGCRVVYVMTDGAALPLAWSETVDRLKREGLLAATVTVGNAFGGDFEAVNKFSGLLAAKAAAVADVIAVAMGPGIVGTGTLWGHTGLEQGEWINAVHILGGTAIAVPRVSFADPRERHRGVSHHFLTALTKVALAPALVPVAVAEGAGEMEVAGTLEAAFAQPGCARHSVKRVEASFLPHLLEGKAWAAQTMGRGYAEDPAPFLAAAAAGRLAAELWRDSRSVTERSAAPEHPARWEGAVPRGKRQPLQ